MKTIAKLAGALVLGMGLATSASALVIASGPFAGTDVGGLDSLIGQTGSLSNSNPTTETAWANSLLDPDATYYIKDENVALYAIAGHSTYYAFQLTGEPGYYIVKNAKFWALFENVSSGDWGVIDASLLPDKMNIGGKNATVSHVTQLDRGGATPPPDAPVPVPGSLALLGIGLLGAGLAGRKKAS